MLGKVALLAGAGAAYVLRTPEGRARVARLLQGVGAGSSGSGGASAPAELTAGPPTPSGAEGEGDGRSRPRLRRAVRGGPSPADASPPTLVDRRPQGSAGEGVSDESSGAHLLPDARPVEIARAVSEEQPPA